MLALAENNSIHIFTLTGYSLVIGRIVAGPVQVSMVTGLVKGRMVSGPVQRKMTVQERSGPFLFVIIVSQRSRM